MKPFLIQRHIHIRLYETLPKRVSLLGMRREPYLKNMTVESRQMK